MLLPELTRRGLGLLLTAALTACSASSDGRTMAHVRVATGGTKGVYYSYGQELAKVLNGRLEGVDASVDPTAGSVENLQRIADSRSTLAFVAADAAADAVEGRGPFSEPLPIRAVARVYDDFVHLVVSSASSARDITGLRGLRVSVGSPSSGTELIANRMLSIAGLDWKKDIRRVRLGINESANALRNGDIDAFFWSGGLPTSGVTELSQSVPVRLLPLGELVDEMRERYGPSYRRATIPIGTYSTAAEVTTIAVPNYLVTNASTDSGLIRRLTWVLFARRDEMARAVPAVALLDRRAAIATVPVPLHDGALRYYRDVKR
ncbi:TAXI family TRAP transporter solute-binding subunit [Streptosporangium sp. NPDC087985]|uniref:TAXI family TRAP transporter solute-binding subunit n=1 Tax=Streptosporangium sp. NPDC087985 TaxID=3366196 RepID=UPI00380F001A